MRADIRHSHFDSSFGRGNYTLLALSRNFRESLRWEVTAGRQSFISPLTRDISYRNLGTTLDWFPGASFFVDCGFNRQRGTVLDYYQWFVEIGYRFDSFKARQRRE